MATYRDVFAYLFDRDRSAYDEGVERFRELRIPGVDEFGPSPNAPQSAPTAAEIYTAKAVALDAALALAENDFDALIRKVDAIRNRRAQVKLFGAILSAVASSSLFGLLGAGQGSSPATYLAAGVSLLGSLATVVQDYLGVKTSEFWDALAQASSCREKVTSLRLRIKLAAPGAAQDIDSLVEPTLSAIAELRTLLSKLRIVDHASSQ